MFLHIWSIKEESRKEKGEQTSNDGGNVYTSRSLVMLHWPEGNYQFITEQKKALLLATLLFLFYSLRKCQTDTSRAAESTFTRKSTTLTALSLSQPASQPIPQQTDHLCLHESAVNRSHQEAKPSALRALLEYILLWQNTVTRTEPHEPTCSPVWVWEQDDHFLYELWYAYSSTLGFCFCNSLWY